MNNDTDHDSRVEVGQLLDAGRWAGLPLLVATFTVLTFVFDGFDIQAIAFAAPALSTALGVDRTALAPVLAAGLLGMGIGGLGIGALGDYIGRRWALIGSLSLVALASLLTAFASSAGELALWRLLTGIGLGGTLPNATALIAEFAPVKVRTLLVSSTVVGVPVGGMLGALVASELIPQLGWRAIFVAGAILPAALVLAMLVLLPESPRYLTMKRHRWPQLAALLNRLARSNRFTGTEQFYIRESQPAASSVGVAVLFTPEFRRETVLVWFIFLTNVFSAYAIFNWLPTVLSHAGLPIATAIRGSFVFNLGGVVGALAAVAFIGRFGSRPVLVAVAFGGILSTLALGFIPLQSESGVASLMLVMIVAGACITTVQVAMYSVTAYIYPTPARASGLGWALGIARFGGILSSFAGSILLGIGEGTRSFFVGIAIVVLLTLVGVLLLRKHVPALR